MIKGNELRIGNYINANGNLVDIGMIREDFVSWDIAKYKKNRVWNPFISLKDERIKPIPLTEQWLLDFGFEKVGDKHFKMHVLRFGKIHFYKRDSGIFECELGQKSGYTLGLIPNLNHLHQLQNLYFVLTGEELTLKKNIDI